jgi:hypothetical protein
LISTIRSVALVAYTEIAPFTPAGTIAALEVTAPVGAFSVETIGWGDPAGHVVRYPTGALGTTVMFKAYASALAGIPQLLEATGKVRGTPPARDGAPKVPTGFRVSAMRQGVTG